MDYKDWLVVASATVGGLAGATVGGGVGFGVGLLLCAAVAATWAAATDRLAALERRVSELEGDAD